MKQAEEITNYRREKREKCVQKLSLLLRQTCVILITIKCLDLYYEAKNGKGGGNKPDKSPKNEFKLSG